MLRRQYPVERIVEKPVAYPVDRYIEVQVPVQQYVPVPVEKIVQVPVNYYIDREACGIPLNRNLIALLSPGKSRLPMRRQVPVDRYVQVPVYVDRYIDRYIDRPIYIPVQQEQQETQSVGVGLSLERADGVCYLSPLLCASRIQDIEANLICAQTSLRPF